MTLSTLGLDINIKHMHLQTLARQDKERQGEETCQRGSTVSKNECKEVLSSHAG